MTEFTTNSQNYSQYRSSQLMLRICNFKHSPEVEKITHKFPDYQKKNAHTSILGGNDVLSTTSDNVSNDKRRQTTARLTDRRRTTGPPGCTGRHSTTADGIRTKAASGMTAEAKSGRRRCPGGIRRRIHRSVTSRSEKNVDDDC